MPVKKVPNAESIVKIKKQLYEISRGETSEHISCVVLRPVNILKKGKRDKNV